MKRILFLHGLESGPGGTKARWLKARYGAVTPALDTSTFPAAVECARVALRAEPPDIVIGSSFGGAVAVRLLATGEWAGPTVLIAPASHKIGSDRSLPPGARVIVLHGDADEVVPVQDSRGLVAGAGPGVQLREIPGGDHRLNQVLDDGTLAGVLQELGAPIVLAG
jgi:pimeloyl-ACP methyl ester carboxylesterase